jgi:hypothetical protein
MNPEPSTPQPSQSPTPPAADETEASADSVCPVCGGALIPEKCKVICRSERCRYRIVFNCAEF